jgi:tRNA(Ile)-lysidine synthase
VNPIRRFQGLTATSSTIFQRVSLRDTTSVRQSVGAMLRGHERVVLAVSGGLDSMVLLDAAAASIAHERLIVATYDHGTGPAAKAARALVERSAATLGIRCVGARATRALSSEAELRDARWSFLDRVAEDKCAVVCTAHTADDQIETVLMRVLRGAGARGLAGLYAASEVLRPFVRLRRRDLARYARAQGLTWVEDPSNDSPRYLRNRIRHHLLPALRRVHPSIDGELLRSARKAARWRAEVESFAAERVHTRVAVAGRALDVEAASLTGYDAAGLSILWPVIASRVGVTLDRRGTARLSEFTASARVGSSIQLSGRWEVVRSRDAFQLRASAVRQPREEFLTPSTTLRWGSWSFHAAAGGGGSDSWSAWLPVDRPLSVRSWRAGDAMVVRDGRAPRKVKRFLSDAGVTGHERRVWPVVLAGEQIVWIPGIRRGEAATARSGRPGLAFVCEYVNR